MYLLQKRCLATFLPIHPQHVDITPALTRHKLDTTGPCKVKKSRHRPHAMHRNCAASLCMNDWCWQHKEACTQHTYTVTERFHPRTTQVHPLTTSPMLSIQGRRPSYAIRHGSGLSDAYLMPHASAAWQQLQTALHHRRNPLPQGQASLATQSTHCGFDQTMCSRLLGNSIGACESPLGLRYPGASSTQAAPG